MSRSLDACIQKGEREMTEKKRRALVGLLAAATCLGLSVPGVATAKSVTFKLKETDKIDLDLVDLKKRAK